MSQSCCCPICWGHGELGSGYSKVLCFLAYFGSHSGEDGVTQDLIKAYSLGRKLKGMLRDLNLCCIFFSGLTQTSYTTANLKWLAHASITSYC